jgi:ribosomal protein S18 acetylase RimI-like enzyme
MSNRISTRKINLNDEEFIWQMLMYASHEKSIDDVRTQAYLMLYVENWGRIGDNGFIAVEHDQPVGASWVRLWDATNKGFGYIDDDTPELVVATIPSARGHGIGTMLINILIEDIRLSYSALSLSVRENNPAVSLYERLGFIKVAGSEIVNRIGGISFIMQKSLI